MPLNSLSRAVQFGKTVDRMQTGGLTAYPFIYTFVPKDKDEWEQVKDVTSLKNNLIDLGPVIPAGQRVDHYVNLDMDYVYKMVYIKYSVYAYITQPVVPIPSAPPVPPIFHFDTASDIPLSQTMLRYVRVNVNVIHNSQYIYGQQNDFRRPFNVNDLSTYPQIPVISSTLEGNEYGPGQVCTPYLLPRQGVLKFEIFNQNTLDIVLAACIYGMKVRL